MQRGGELRGGLQPLAVTWLGLGVGLGLGLGLGVGVGVGVGTRLDSRLQSPSVLPPTRTPSTRKPSDAEEEEESRNCM